MRDEPVSDLDRLNVLLGPYERWQTVSSNKCHTDEFGNEVKAGDTYYRRPIGCGWGDVLKLSERSFRVLTIIMFHYCPELNIRLSKLAEDEKRQQQEARMRAQSALDLSMKITLPCVATKTEVKETPWQALDADHLRTLVWTKPTTEVAKEFGVSDSMIGKRCRKLGVAKPPPGFWARVAAGKVPDPKGVPTRPDSSDAADKP